MTHAPLPQNPCAVFMVRPTAFSVNAETAADNHFQRNPAEGDRAAALAEFDAMARALDAAGIEVIAVDQHRDDIPDAVFPNNWFSTHHDGTLVLYPMFAHSRRRERREDIAGLLSPHFTLRERMDLSGLEDDDRFLEGTGAIVFDHQTRTAYMARSQRADEDILSALCAGLDYTPFSFDAVDGNGRQIYHTNVMMAIGQHTVLVGFDTITNPVGREVLRSRVASGGRVVVSLSHAQIAAFAGNALEVDGRQGPVLVLSTTALAALSPADILSLEAKVKLLPVAIPTIEKSGGSARCMLAGLHLPRR